jgi:hypothetical protein
MGRSAVAVAHDELQIAADRDCRRHRRHNGARHALGKGARRERFRPCHARS